jgi:SAM-dependent methyltransferase
MRQTWLGYDSIAEIYEYDMGQNMPFDDTGYYVRHATRSSGEVLDLGCGTGRVSLALLKAHLAVTAVDSSAPMLERLRDARTNLSPAQAERLRIIQMDVRDWALRAKFETVLCPYSLFTYFVEEHEYASVLESVRNSLLDDGQFICDVFIPRGGTPYGQTTRDYQRRLPDGSLLTRSKVIVADETVGVHKITRHYERSRGANSPERFTTIERIRLWYPDALECTLKRHFFDVVARDFDYEFSGDEISAQFATFRCRRTRG